MWSILFENKLTDVAADGTGEDEPGLQAEDDDDEWEVHDELPPAPAELNPEALSRFPEGHPGPGMAEA